MYIRLGTTEVASLLSLSILVPNLMTINGMN